MNILAVAEKPSVAKELAAILSNNHASSRQGRSPYNRIFECNNVEFRGRSSSLLLFVIPPLLGSQCLLAGLPSCVCMYQQANGLE